MDVNRGACRAEVAGGSAADRTQATSYPARVYFRDAFEGYGREHRAAIAAAIVDSNETDPEVAA